MAARSNDSNEIRITRLYDAPVSAVWDAWTDPAQVAQWWGPRGFTITTHSKDLRVGGTWVYTMHGPDGTDYPNRTVYHEVVPRARLVYDHGASDDRPALFRVTVEFTEEAGKTRMEMTMTLPTPQAAAETRVFIKKAGGNSTWDRLAEHLTHRATGEERFVINRSFDCPIERMYQMWTDPEHLARWIPPTGSTMKFLHADIRVGGTTHAFMSNRGSLEMWSRAEYLELTPPRRIVYTQQFVDEHCKVTRHPLAPTWPETMLTVVTLTEEGPDRTRVTVTWAPYGRVTDEELAIFIKARAGMTMGWTGSFDKLDDQLAAA